MRCPTSILLAAACLLALPTAAAAAELPRVDVQGAVGMCKAMTKADNDVTRYRPLALTNEGTGTVWVACNWQGDDAPNTVRAAKRLAVMIGNHDGVAHDVSCTLVNGHQTGALLYASYTPKTVNIPANGSAEISWVPSEIANAAASGIDRPSMSCVLPPQVSLQYTTREYNEDVGA